MVKNPPAVWKTWVQSLNREDPLEKGTATHSSILVWRIPMDRRAWAIVHGTAKNHTTERLSKKKKKSTQLDNISTWYKIKITKGNVMLIITGV